MCTETSTLLGLEIETSSSSRGWTPSASMRCGAAKAVLFGRATSEVT